MKIKVSKVFADFINRTAKELGFECEARVVTMGVSSYRMNVSSDVYTAEEYGDYDCAKGVYKAIRLDYPAGYCAMPQYLTTPRLCTEFRRSKVTDVDGLKRMVRDICEI